MAMNRIIHGDSIALLPHLKYRPTMVFADPPDNLGVKYVGYHDRMPPEQYRIWLQRVLVAGIMSGAQAVWLSYYYIYQPIVWESAIRLHYVGGTFPHFDLRQFIWRFTFGQHRQKDCGNGYRPIMRVSREDFQWQTDAIRARSKRQEMGDKRADKRGRVPDDVWEYPRVCGTFKERRRWAKCQHPEALIERMVKMTCRRAKRGRQPLVVDMFAHSGTVNRVCKRLDIDCIGIDISKFYCEKIAEETGAELVRMQ